jgi:hypothetical protein
LGGGVYDRGRALGERAVRTIALWGGYKVLNIRKNEAVVNMAASFLLLFITIGRFIDRRSCHSVDLFILPRD